MIKECLILAAGYGSRLNPITRKIPKPMLPLGELRLIDNSINIAKKNSLKPIVATGYLNKQLNKYLLQKNIDYFTIESPSTNLLESIALAKNYISGENFMWIGGAMFINIHQEIGELIHSHLKLNVFCSFFYQDEIRYTPKLIIENKRLKKFIVGKADTRYSSPTIFIVKKDFISFCEKYSEKEVFQEIIKKELEFNLVKLRGGSLEIHDVNDYIKILKYLYPLGYISNNSQCKYSKIIKSHIYDSNINNSQIVNSLVIQSNIDGQIIENSVIFNNQKITK